MDRVASATAKYRKENPPKFEVGDTVDVLVRIQEGDKERVQVFTGVVIQIKGSGIARNFTVRRIVQGEGVERVFPVHSPFVVDVKVRKHAKVRRAKLYYLRGRTGKKARMKERFELAIADTKSPAETDATPAKPRPPAEAVVTPT